MNTITAFSCITIFLFGITVGSFLNVCILRLPLHEDIVSEPSHCMKCGRRLTPFELIPLFSWIFLGGKCHGCKCPISAQYPLIEAVNGALWVLIYAVSTGGGVITPHAVLGMLMTSALIVLSVIDMRTFEIPFSCVIVILVTALAETGFDYVNWLSHLIGLFAVSLPLYLIYLLTKGRGIGGGDIKLMAVCGLFLGWEKIIPALFIGCIIGSVVHLLRMKFSDAGKVLSLGPYLSVGVFTMLLWGDRLIELYLGLMSV